MKILTPEKCIDIVTGISYRIVNSKTESFTDHSHNFSEIFVMLSGFAKHSANGKSAHLKKGDIVFIRPSDIHKFSELHGETFTFCNLTFTNETRDQLFDFLGDGFPSIELLSSSIPPFSRMTEREVSRFETKLAHLSAIPQDNASERKTALRILLIDLFTVQFSNFRVCDDGIPGWLDELCQKMRSDANFVEGSEKMIELSGRSREHLSRSMKKYMSMTISEFVNDLRLNYIANMLRNSNKKISVIVFDSGFNTLSLAGTLFVKKYGMNMRQYRSFGDIAIQKAH